MKCYNIPCGIQRSIHDFAELKIGVEGLVPDRKKF